MMRIGKILRVMPLVVMAALPLHLNAQNMENESQNGAVPQMSAFPTGNENVAYRQ